MEDYKRNTVHNAKVDLTIAFIATILFLIFYLLFENIWKIKGRDESINFWLRFGVISLSAYGLAGLGFTIIFLFRKEKLKDYGLIKDKILLSIVFSILSFIPHFLFMFFRGVIEHYSPMNGTVLTESVLRRRFPINIFCMFILFLIWGFFEGITYVFFSKKINIIFPPKYKLLNYGAIFCGIICVLVHGIIGINILDIIEGITVFIFIYGILITKELTNNSWGCIFAFLFLWNAF